MADVSSPFMMKFVTDNVLLVLKDWLYNQKITLYLIWFLVLKGHFIPICLFLKFEWISIYICHEEFYILRPGKWLWLPPSGYYGYISVFPLRVVCHSESQKHLLNLALHSASQTNLSGMVYIYRETAWSISTLSIVCLKYKRNIQNGWVATI